MTTGRAVSQGSNYPSHDKYPWVRVVWVDSCEPMENEEIEIPAELPEVQVIVQVGFLLREDSESVTIAGGFKPDLARADYVITIPKRSIVSGVERLEKISVLKKGEKT